MDKLIPDAYRRYGHYVNNFRAFPLIDDGLKPVERRILLTAYIVARDKFVKSARVTGTCMARFHPHADPYGTLVQMVNQDFIIGQGNWGCNLGSDPTGAAASRYTECKMSPDTEDMAFKLIKHVPWSESELDDEPDYLPTKYPFCLMGNKFTEGIGFGYRTFIPCYDIEDLKARLLWLLSNKEGTEPIIKPKINCKITSPKTTLQTLLTVGKAKLDITGFISVNNVACKAIIKSWPPGKKFETLLNKGGLKKQFENQDIGFIDSSSGQNGTAIIFSVLKQRNRTKIFNELVKNLKTAIKGSVSFECITVDRNSNVRVTSIDEMLINTYQMFTQANKRMLISEINKVKESIDELGNLEKLKGPLATVLGKSGLTLTKETLDSTIKELAKQSQLTQEIVKHLLTKYRIQKLLTVSTDTNELNAKQTELQNNLAELDKFVLAQY